MLDATAHVGRLPSPSVWDVNSTADRLVDAGAFVSRDLNLAGFTTLRVGGPAPIVAECSTTQALVDAVRFLDAASIPTLLIAGGSNLVIGDAGWDGVVIRIATSVVRLGDNVIAAEAGAVWDDVVATTVDAGLGGLECLSGIPGSAGATPVQNVGAYGVEVGSVLHRVRLLDRRSGEIRWVETSELGLGYRTSVLKHSEDALVLDVELQVSPDGLSAPIRYRELTTTLSVGEGDQVPAAQARDAVLGLRRGKGMVLDAADHDTWSAGSFFTNPVVPDAEVSTVMAAITRQLGDIAVPSYPADGGVKLSAGWLIERAGFGKGYPGNGAVATLSTKHTLALTNRGSASASDIASLARTVRDGVRGAFGVELFPEPVTVGFKI
ncbi:MAG: UDP-N-acetylmuramate dehydrogenase [Rhodococcus sp.]|nr:UDP-N-acetylmuramate dehydrogenase [Rhodococcus sp. (in: high G+C Gram-positive bacteria)]